MIDIIKEPPKKYVESCGRCGCIFSYELSDLTPTLLKYNMTIRCPKCGYEIIHKPQNK